MVLSDVRTVILSAEMDEGAGVLKEKTRFFHLGIFKLTDKHHREMSELYNSWSFFSWTEVHMTFPN